MNATTTIFAKGFLTAALIGGLSAAAFAQEVGKPKPTVSPMPWPTTPMPGRPAPPPPGQRSMGNETYERSIPVASNIKFEMCMNEGTLRVNGWSRNEVRIFVRKGGRFNFDVRDTSGGRDDKPVWLKAVGYDPRKGPNPPAECLWGERVEIDVPANTTLVLQGKVYRANLDSIKKVDVKALDGFIAVSNIAAGAHIHAGKGNINIDDSEGPFNLYTAGGNISVFEVRPADIGDAFEAKTQNGNITLESMTHRQVQATSVSGTIVYGGEIRNGGSYYLNTESGTIRTTLAPTVSCTLNVIYAYGNFYSELDLKKLPDDASMGSIKRGNFALGKGGPLLRLQTTTGNIYIKKAPAATAP